MSLLMQALKQAEHAKKAAQDLAAEADAQDAGLDAPAPAKLAAPAHALALEDVAPPAATPETRHAPAALDYPTLELAEDPPLADSGTTTSQAAGLAADAPVATHYDIDTAQKSAARAADALVLTPVDHVPPPMQPEAPAPRQPQASLPAAQAVDKQPQPAPRTGPQPASRPEADAAPRKIARAVFDAKSGEKKSRLPLIGAIGGIAALLLCGAAYWYLQAMQPTSLVTAAATVPASVPAETSAVEPAAPASDATGAAQGAESNPVAAETDASGARLPAAGTPGAAAARSDGSTPAVATTPVAAPKTSPVAEQAATPPARPVLGSEAIQIRKNQEVEAVDPVLTRAWRAFNNGETDMARQLYQEALRAEPTSRDALLGLAAIAVLREQPSQAGGYYVRLLELDPLDPDAMAGLASLQQGDPSQNESRLKKVLAQHPQAAPVLFALGNLYARQSRWADAQQYYFRALGAAPANADYAFNLAVSLDRLDQPKLALDYYQRALSLAQTSRAAFSADAVRQRVRDLQSIHGEAR